jgi:hypothetical protein
MRTLINNMAFTLALLGMQPTAHADGEEFICLVVLCVYGDKYGGGDAEGCIPALDEYLGFVKEISGKLSCPLTIAQRIAWMSQCKENRYSLKDIVTCDT